MMGQYVLRALLVKVQKSKWFTIMADEAKDYSNKEQLSVVIRWVAADYVLHEDFIVSSI